MIGGLPLVMTDEDNRIDTQQCEEAKACSKEAQASADTVHDWTFIHAIKLENCLGISLTVEEDWNISEVGTGIIINHECAPRVSHKRSPRKPFPSFWDLFKHNK